MRNNTISSTAQQIVLSTLNGVETEGRSVQQLIALFNSNKPTMNVALDDLEQANLAIRCHGKGQNRREKQLVWLKSSRKLWTAALPFLQSPVSGIVYSATPAQSSFFTISGETLLHERVPEFTSKAKTCYVHLEESGCDNEKRVAKLPFKKASCRVEFWRYPPILPGQSKIDNLSLYLALDSAHDPKVRDYRDKLIETFPWNNQEVKTPRS